GEVDQDRARLEQRERFTARTVLIHDGGHLAVRADRHELGLELVAGADVDHVQPVGDARLLEEDRNLAAVAGRPGVNVDHGSLLLFIPARAFSPEVRWTGSYL